MLLPDDLAEPPFTDDDLDAYFAWEDTPYDGPSSTDPGVMEPEPEPRLSRWSIEDTGAAEWSMRKLAHVQAEIASTNARAAEFIRQIERWRQDQLKPLVRPAEFFDAALQDYLRRVREADPKKKSVKLPSGEITSTLSRERPGIVQGSEAEFIGWAKSSGLDNLVRVKEEPDVNEMKKVVKFRPVVVPFDSEYNHDLCVVGDRLVAFPSTIDTKAGGPGKVDADALDSLLAAGTFVEALLPVWTDVRGNAWLVRAVELVPEKITYKVEPAKP